MDLIKESKNDDSITNFMQAHSWELYPQVLAS